MDPREAVNQPVDLLLITWNRREYVAKTLVNLFASKSDFRLFCWDNASADGTADIIASLDDPRVVRKQFSPVNAMQRDPTLWFFEQAVGDLAGKIDDDILLPDGWIERIAPLVRAEPSFGMLACWIYMPEDWDEALAAPKILEVGGTRIFRNTWVAGQSFLARRELLKKYVIPPGIGYGFPINQVDMTEDGLINGYPLPMLMAENMDDPRSPHCLMNSPGGMGEQAALTARMRGFATPQAYGEWIARDARKTLLESVEDQLREARRARDRSLFGRARSRLGRILTRISGR